MKAFNYSDKRVKIITHILMWVVVFSLPYILYKTNDRPPHTLTDAEKAGFLYVNLISNVFWVGMFYLNAFILVPRLIYKKEFLQYATVVLLSYGVIMTLHTFL